MVKQDEVDDILHILETCHKKRNFKGICLSLEILGSNGLCPAQYLSNLSENQTKIIEAMINNKSLFDQSFEYDERSFHDIEIVKSLANNVLLRVFKSKRSDNSSMVQSQHGVAKNENFIPKEATLMATLKATFERPASMKTCLFQLNETNDLNRITFLLDSITNQYLDRVEQLCKSGFLKSLTNIIDKYCNGDFGFDNIESTKYCIFQNRLFQSLLALFEFNNLTLSKEFFKDSLNQIAQIIEEGLIYIVQNVTDLDRTYEYEYKKFFETSLNLFKVFITNHSKSNMVELTSALNSIEERIRIYFTSHTKDDLDQEELDIFYEDLRTFYENLKKLRIKTEAINDMVYTKPTTKHVKMLNEDIQQEKENSFCMSNVYE